MRRICFFVLVLTLVLSACSGRQSQQNRRDSAIPAEFQVKESSGSVSDFYLNIAQADAMGDWVVDWRNDCLDGEGFQYFIYSDPDSWDVYLYLPRQQSAVQSLTNEDVTVSFSDGVLNVSVTASETEEDPLEGDWMLHFAAPPRGVWPSEVALFWNGASVPCDSVSYEN